MTFTTSRWGRRAGTKGETFANGSLTLKTSLAEMRMRARSHPDGDGEHSRAATVTWSGFSAPCALSAFATAATSRSEGSLRRGTRPSTGFTRRSLSDFRVIAECSSASTCGFGIVGTAPDRRGKRLARQNLWRPGGTPHRHRDPLRGAPPDKRPSHRGARQTRTATLIAAQSHVRSRTRATQVAGIDAACCAQLRTVRSAARGARDLPDRRKRRQPVALYRTLPATWPAGRDGGRGLLLHKARPARRDESVPSAAWHCSSAPPR
jgi:hypothetical protein